MRLANLWNLVADLRNRTRCKKNSEQFTHSTVHKERVCFEKLGVHGVKKQTARLLRTHQPFWDNSRCLIFREPASSCCILQPTYQFSLPSHSLHSATTGKRNLLFSLTKGRGPQVTLTLGLILPSISYLLTTQQHLKQCEQARVCVAPSGNRMWSRCEAVKWGARCDEWMKAYFPKPGSVCLDLWGKAEVH